MEEIGGLKTVLGIKDGEIRFEHDSGRLQMIMYWVRLHPKRIRFIRSSSGYRDGV